MPATNTVVTVQTSTAAVTVSLTELEISALQVVAESEYQDGDYDKFADHGPVWSNCLAGYGLLTNRNVSGVISSLSKKELLTSSPYDRGVDVVLLTEAGHAAYIATRTVQTQG